MANNRTGAIDRCLAALAAGPATTGKVAILLGIPIRNASANLQHLYRRGIIYRRPLKVDRSGRAGPRNVWQWSRVPFPPDKR